MKIMRFFPLLALATLGFIGYGLYKTSNFVNRKVDKYTLLSQDSVVKRTSDSMARLRQSGLPDTMSSSATSLVTSELLATTPLPTVATKQETTTAKKEGAATTSKQPSTEVKKDPSSAESLTTKTTPAVTAKGVATTTTANTPTTEAAKNPQTRAITKPAATVKKDVILKPASVVVKKEATDTRFYVVVGTYGQEANAKNKAAAFEQKNNKKATVVKQGTFFRVCADEFEFGQAASQYAQKLKEAGEESIVVKF